MSRKQIRFIPTAMVSIDDVELPIPIVGTIEGLLQVSSFSGTRLQYILIKCVRLQATSPCDRNLIICSLGRANT